MGLTSTPAISPSESQRIIEAAIQTRAERFKHVVALPLRDHLKLLCAFKQLRTQVQNDGVTFMHVAPAGGTSGGAGESADVPPPYSKEGTPASVQPAAGSSSGGNRDGRASSKANGKANASGPTPPRVNADAAESRWTEFLTRALVRFDQWLRLLVLEDVRARAPPSKESGRETTLRKRLILADLRLEAYEASPIDPFINARPLPVNLLPPLDVALIWHCYMLNPARYIDDAVRLEAVSTLTRYQFPMKSLARCLNDSQYYAPQEAQALFESRLHTPYDPIAASRVSPAATVSCPRAECTGRTQMSYSDLALNPTWSKKCERCSILVNANICKGGNFMADLVVWCDSAESDRSGSRMRGGTFSSRDSRPFFKDPYSPLLDRMFINHRRRTTLSLNEQGMISSHPDEDILGKIKDGQHSPYGLLASAQQDILQIADTFQSYASRVLNNGIFSKSRALEIARMRTDVLMRYYIDSHPLTDFSLDLVAAARRQESFIDEMENLGWLANEGTGVDTAGLVNATTRYRLWLVILGSNPDLFLSPTLDIDLLWHTHQLSQYYYTDCNLILGKFLDHDDKVEKGDLKDAFQRTADVWMMRYGQPYSLCGCCRQPDSGISRITGSLKSKLNIGKDKARDDGNVQGRDGPDHPSAHNAVTICDGFAGVGGSSEDKVDSDRKPSRTHANAFV